MTTYRIRYGRTVNLGNYETARLELEEQFNDADMPDRRDAMIQVAKMVEGYAQARKKHPELFAGSTNCG